MTKNLLTAAAMLALLTSCGSSDEAALPVENKQAAQKPAGDPNLADLNMAGGKKIGEVRLAEDGTGIKVSIKTTALNALPFGELATHIHATGKCEGDFASAGGHWNPENREHGPFNPKGFHAGDLGNILTTPGNGSMLEITYPISGFSLTSATKAPRGALIDADGVSVIIHAGKDDQKTDPDGGSGKRIACAAFPGR